MNRLFMTLAMVVLAGCGARPSYILALEATITESPSKDFFLYWSRTTEPIGEDVLILFAINSRRSRETGVENLFPEIYPRADERFVLAWDESDRVWLLLTDRVLLWTVRGRAWQMEEFPLNSANEEVRAYIDWAGTVRSTAPPRRSR